MIYCVPPFYGKVKINLPLIFQWEARFPAENEGGILTIDFLQQLKLLDFFVVVWVSCWGWNSGPYACISPLSYTPAPNFPSSSANFAFVRRICIVNLIDPPSECLLCVFIEKLKSHAEGEVTQGGSCSREVLGHVGFALVNGMSAKPVLLRW